MGTYVEKSHFLGLGQKGVFVPSVYDLLQDELVWEVCESGPLPEVLESGMRRVGAMFLPSVVSSLRSWKWKQDGELVLVNTTGSRKPIEMLSGLLH